MSGDLFAKNANAAKDAELLARILASYHKTLVEEGKMNPQWAGKLTEHYFNYVLPPKKP